VVSPTVCTAGVRTEFEKVSQTEAGLYIMKIFLRETSSITENR